MGRAYTIAEARGVAMARDAVLALTAMFALFWALTWWLGPGPGETPADVAAQEMRMLSSAVAFGMLAYGLHRVWTIAWVFTLLISGLSVLGATLWFVEDRSLIPAVILVIYLPVAMRLLDGNARRAFLRVRRHEVEAPVDDQPDFRLPTVMPVALMEEQALVPAYVPPPVVADPYAPPPDAYAPPPPSYPAPSYPAPSYPAYGSVATPMAYPPPAAAAPPPPPAPTAPPAFDYFA